jgi:hypothetical protein
MRIACFTTVYNNADHLPVWIRYYGGAVGLGNLSVLDHGSDDGSIGSVPREVSVVRLPRRQVDEIGRTAAVNAFAAALLNYYDTVIYTDCDEFIVPDPAVYPGGLRDYCGRCPPRVAPVGLNVLHMTDREGPLDYRHPILRQRRFCRFASAMCKPLIVREPITWRAGFHFAEQPASLETDIYLFHLKAADRETALRRHQFVRTLPWSKKDVARGLAVGARTMSDEDFIARHFTEPLSELAKTGDRKFDFDADLARMRTELASRPEAFVYSFFYGKVARIPKRFRDCL